MRMRKKPNLSARMERCESVWIHDPVSYRGHWRDLLPGAKELRIEVGCGKGKFTAETAAAEPDVLLIAIEKVPDALVMAMERTMGMGLKNVFYLTEDVERLCEFFAPDEADLIYINFCDPWPRNKTANRRLTYRDFLKKYRYVLKTGGQIHFKTDNEKLFDFSLHEFALCDLETRAVTRNLHEHGPVGIMTGYEERFYNLGQPIFRCEAVVGEKKEEDYMQKLSMKTPLVEMDGDEMTRILWKQIKEQLLEPYIDLKTEYYDLGLPHRDETSDQVTIDAANATRRLGVAVKCATITPNAQRMDEYHLHEMWKSPNGTIRAILDGTVFRAPVLVDGISPVVRNWKAPITIARHAYGDIYKAAEMRVGKGKAELVFTDEEGNESRELIYDFECPGVLSGQYNKDSSIESFARSCFNYALDTKQDLWFSAKDTIAKKYDGEFNAKFQQIFDAEYADRFREAGIEYFYTLIDDAVARVIRSKGGFIWACKNYDGDVMSDMISTAFGSLAMMTSVLVSPDGKYEYEAAHGTVTRHYYRYLAGEETSTNPVATIFAWTGALRKRGELDETPGLCSFADKLERACIQTIESGVMTKDLSLLWEKGEPQVKNSEQFLAAIRQTLDTMM